MPATTRRKAATAKQILLGQGYQESDILLLETVDTCIYNAALYDGGKTDTVYGKIVVIATKTLKGRFRLAPCNVRGARPLSPQGSQETCHGPRSRRNRTICATTPTHRAPPLPIPTSASPGRSRRPSIPKKTTSSS